MKVLAGLTAAAKVVLNPKPESFRAGGKQVICAHCENILFHQKRTRVGLYFNLYSSRTVCTLVCANCTRIEWFEEILTPDA